MTSPITNPENSSETPSARTPGRKLRFEDVPVYETTEFFPRKTKYCFVPIVYNEGERFRRQLDDMSKNAHLADIIVAERRSTDGSTAPDLLKSKGVRTLLTTDSPGGATAIRGAFQYALREGYEGVVLIDGHGKDGVESLPEYIRQLDAGMDFVQGSRFMKGGVQKNTPVSREVGIKYIMAPLLWIGGGFWYTDGTNGFRGYSRKFLEHPRVEPLRACFTHFNLQYFLSYAAPKLKLNVVEIPVKRVYPDDGTVPTKVIGLKHNFMAFWEMVRTIAGKYDPPA